MKKKGKDNDVSVKEISTAYLWQIGDLKNQTATEAILKEPGTNEAEIEELK